jgi:hypothetical protein
MSATPRAHGRRAIALGLTAAAVTALAGPAAAGASSRSPFAALGTPKTPTARAGVALDRLERAAAAQVPRSLAAATAHRERVASAAWRAERRRSRHAFGGLVPRDALRLTEQQFGGDVRGASHVPGLGLTAGRVVAWHGTNRATIDPPGPRRRADVVSTLPMRAGGGAGELAPIDLGLTGGAGGWTPRNAAVPVRLPGHADGAATVGDIGLTASLGDGGAARAAGRMLGDGAVFYPDAGTDADLTTAPTVGGLETFFTLRSVDAPQDGTLRLHLPTGARLVAQDDGSVAIVRGTATIGTVSAPRAFDAQGTAVPTTASVDGDAITIHTAHRSGDYAYPILVDPDVVLDGFDGLNTDSISTVDGYGDPALVPTNPDNGTWYGSDGASVHTHGAGGSHLDLADDVGLEPGSQTEVWAWLPPNGTSHLYSADFGPFTFDLGGDADDSGDTVTFVIDTPEYQATSSTGAATVDDEVTLTDEDATDPDASTVPIAGMLLSRETYDPATSTDPHTVALHGAAFEVDAPYPAERADIDGPVLAGAQSTDLTVYTNQTELDGAQGDATSIHGVKKTVITAQHGTDPEFELGSDVDPCTDVAPDLCPTSFHGTMDMDLSSFVEGETYRLRLRAYDSANRRSAAQGLNLVLDQTAPDIDLGGDVAALDGTTTSSTATLDLTADASDALSGLDQVWVEDSAVEWGSGGISCSDDPCDPATFHVPLGLLSNGPHTLTVHATDIAGNESTEHVTFTVTGH